jgi:hypothetical protein
VAVGGRDGAPLVISTVVVLVGLGVVTGSDDGTTVTGPMNVAGSTAGRRSSAVVTLCEV